MAAETRNAVRNPGDFEAIAASWERRREEIEGVTTPVREWLLRELAPPPRASTPALADVPGP